VTRTLANAIKSGRIAQSFVFAGPRGVGKTTTARILARALNCEKGPTRSRAARAMPAAEITEGRDIDVMEMDAAYAHADRQRARGDHPGALDHAGAKPLQGLHHRRGPPALEHSFNALLKSIEEPPPHVVFMMATTELSKIPETVLSRSQVFEFKTISSKQIAISSAGLPTQKKLPSTTPRCCCGAGGRRQHARRAERVRSGHRVCRSKSVRRRRRRQCWDLWAGSRARHRHRCCGRDAAAAFELPAAPSSWATTCGRSSASCRACVRDLLVLSVDPSRIDDPEIASESERDR
jgi:DNA polymerase-3 subunit gamma/tau